MNNDKLIGYATSNILIQETKKPLILVITDGMFAGGRERQITELLKELKRKGHFRTVLAVLDRGGILEAEAATFVERILPIQRGARFDITPVFGLLRYALSAKVSLIHTFGWMSGLAGLFVARLLHLPMLNSGIRSAPPRLLFRHRISRRTMRHADAIVANSHAGLQAYGLSEQPHAHVIHNGLDMTRFLAVVPEASSQPKVCMVANFSDYKDHATVIRSIKIVSGILPDVRLTLVGQDVGTLSNSYQLVYELGLSASVEFITNTIYPQPYIAGSDVCVLASTRNESLSNAILEYMALGKPVVATACMGNAELIQEANGFLVPSGSPEELAKRVIELLHDPMQAQRMGKAGRQRVIKEFSLEKMGEKYEGVYKMLLNT